MMCQVDNETSNNNDAEIVLLTLEDHKEGVWITRLLEALALELALQQRNTSVQVVTLESLLDNMDPTRPLFSSPIPTRKVIVNRVSDAAAPHLQKACVAVLQLASAMNHRHHVRVFNGPISYGLCTNKWCHHVLFHRAGLYSPSTRALLDPTDTTCQQALLDLSSSSLLLKPNAGGFGAGIERITTTTRANLSDKVSRYSDRTALIQTYISSHSTFRVWFLGGKIQCGMERPVPVLGDDDDDDRDQFSSACVANVCTAKKKQKHQPRFYDVPKEVINELQDKLLPLLPDAHAGSVEYLVDEEGSRRYFDLNLLSTLPLQNNNDDFSHWKELAHFIVNMIE